jgi:hypothetical protein
MGMNNKILLLFLLIFIQNSCSFCRRLPNIKIDEVKNISQAINIFVNEFEKVGYNVRIQEKEIDSFFDKEINKMYQIRISDTAYYDTLEMDNALYYMNIVIYEFNDEKEYTTFFKSITRSDIHPLLKQKAALWFFEGNFSNCDINQAKRIIDQVVNKLQV